MLFQNKKKLKKINKFFNKLKKNIKIIKKVIKFNVKNIDHAYPYVNL